MNNENLTKCGKIYLNNKSGEFSFFCTFRNCENHFAYDLGKFADHLYKHHSQLIQEAMSQQEQKPSSSNNVQTCEMTIKNEYGQYSGNVMQSGSSETTLKRKSVTFETSPPKTYNYTPNQSSNSNSSNSNSSNSSISNSSNECNVCGKTFENFNNLQHHKAMKHNQSTSASDYGSHFKVRGSPPPKRKTPESTLMSPYMDYESQTHPFACQFCQKRFKSRQYHRIHERLHNDEDFATRFQCGKCDKTFSHETHFSNHQEIHKKNRKKFECNICKKKFVTETYLEEHKKLKHLTPETNIAVAETTKLVKCSYCPLKYSPAYLSIHELKHTQGAQFKCDYCDRKFLTKGQKVAHEKNRHIEKEKEFFCPECKKGFYSKGNMQQHIKKQHNLV